MNKRNKIIVSIVGITIVLLALLGITYAYYLTRIEGNTNTNSISITTANLKLVYGDGNGLLTATNIMPGKQVEFKTSDNTTTTEKNFTVTNSGNSTIEGYAVSLDYAYIADTMPSIFERPEDFQITLTCTTSITGETCNGFTGNFNNESIMLTSNDIDEGEIHTYSLSIYYNDPGVDQSNDMGKNLNLKVQIYNLSETTDIEGIINGVDSTHSVRIESEPKMSTIVNGKYSFKGIEVGTHTLTVLDKDGNEIDKEYIVVKSGTSSGITSTKATIDNTEVDAIGITITKDERVAKLSTKFESNILSFDTTTSSIGKLNPYSSNKNSLAYHMINNAMNSTYEENIEGRAMYRTQPDTPVASDIARYRENIVTTAESWNYNKLYGDLYYACTGTTATTCTGDMVGKWYSAIGECGVAGVITGCDSSGKPIVGTFTDKYESSLTLEDDDLGTSYYYRGNVRDNYVSFADMCWRIVRIEGDGAVKLILEDKNELCSSSMIGDWSIPTTTGGSVFEGNFGYTLYSKNTLTASDGTKNSSQRILMDYLHPQTNANKSMGYAFKNFQSTFTENELSKMRPGNWCFGNEAYDEYNNLLSSTQAMDYKIKNTWYFYDYDYRFTEERGDFIPTLKCNGEIMDTWDDDATNPTPMYVGAITGAEQVYAGGQQYITNQNYYLINNYHISGCKEFRLLSPISSLRDEDIAISLSCNGFVFGYTVAEDVMFRPSISLISGVEIISGDGTQTNPYVIN